MNRASWERNTNRHQRPDIERRENQPLALLVDFDSGPPAHRARTVLCSRYSRAATFMQVSVLRKTRLSKGASGLGSAGTDSGLQLYAGLRQKIPKLSQPCCQRRMFGLETNRKRLQTMLAKRARRKGP